MNELRETILFFFRTFDREFIALFLTIPRIYAFLETAQLLNSSAVPRLTRTVAILSLAIAAVPINMVHVEAFDRTIASIALLVVKEGVIGFVLGYLVGWIFWAVQSAGALIDNQRGAAIAASIDPMQGQETSPLGILFSQAFFAYVYAAGVILPVLGLLYQSYAIWPATVVMPAIAPNFPELVLGFTDQAMRLVVVLAGPIIAVMFLAEFALAIVSRFAPQVQVFILAMPIKSGLAIFMLIFYFSVLLPHAADQMLFVTDVIGRLRSVVDPGGPLLLPNGIIQGNP
jgi:type III secretion protein T